jgi:5-methylthioribose kinase
MTQLRLEEKQLARYLQQLGLVPAGAEVEVEPAGDGNINWVRRARFAAPPHSFVVKQARPELERFPEYQAPTERILFEARYYERARPLEPTPICPRVIHFDARERVLVLEDLGSAERMDAALLRGADLTPALRDLGAFLGVVHEATCDLSLGADFPNDSMRRLHGEHIFALPLRANDFPLSDALRRRATTLAADRELVAIADACHARYLEPRGALNHGDVQAGNILLPPESPCLLDAEIAHLGDPAFDVGTLLAHIVLPAVARGRANDVRTPVVELWGAYCARRSRPPAFPQVARYAGLEMLRRTIGAARVAAVSEDAPSLAVLDVAARLTRTPPELPEALIS